MLIGILSDTHGNTRAAKQGIDVLFAAGAERFIHCGDIGFGVVELLPPGRSWFVFGNNDFDHAELRDQARAQDIVCLNDFGQFDMAGKKIAVAHGDIFKYTNPIIEAESHDYLFTGHTHRKHDLRVGRLRRINPGALSKPRDGSISVATLDLLTDNLTMIVL
jgi:uncharacterized protein